MSPRRKLILIVDDNRDVRFVFGAILNYDGFDIIEAPNGRVAVEYARRLMPDLILMDKEMPLLDGIDAARQLRARTDTAGIPIILVSGHDFTSDESALIQSLFDRVLAKPVLPKAILREVQRFIGASPAPPPSFDVT